jgi:hypothetical protein
MGVPRSGLFVAVAAFVLFITTGVCSAKTVSYSYQFFQIPGATGGTYADAINDSGEIAGSFYDESGAHAFIRTRLGVYSYFDDPFTSAGQGSVDPWNTYAYGIDNAGDVVGAYYNENGIFGFLRNGNSGVMTTIVPPFPNGNQTIVYKVFDNGDLEGNYVDSSSDSRGFIYRTSGEFVTVSGFPDGNVVTIPGVTNSAVAFDSNGQGQFVGYFHPDGASGVSFIATPLAPIPEPGTWMISVMGCATAGLTLRQRRKLHRRSKDFSPLPL